jgi:hypothetical protein
MGFDQRWFDILRTISPSVVDGAHALGIERRTPNLFELADNKSIPPDFVTPAKELIRELNNSPYPFGMTFFRAAPRHIFTFPANRVYRWQWNIGFAAEEDPRHDHARVGIGLYAPTGKEGSDAWFKYDAFQKKVRDRPSAFSALMRQFEDYCEPEGFALPQGSMDSVLNDSPEMPFWRFFGSRLEMTSLHHRTILSSTHDLASYAVGIFKQIDEAGFYVD